MNDKPVCKYGASCYRKNPQHFAEFSHPDKEKREAEDSLDSGKKKAMKKPIVLVSPNQDMGEAFPDPFHVNDYGEVRNKGIPPYTLVELRMMGMMGSIKDKPEWYKKILQDSIVAKWRKEMMEQGIHQSQIDYIIAELQDEAKSSSAALAASPVDGVYQSDAIIPEQLRQALLKQVFPLENVNNPDYHPGSKEQMVDLVHPSLYPYVAGLSKEVLVEGETWENFIGGGELVDRKLREEKKHSWNEYKDTSDLYQWLPSEVSISKEGKAKFESYINNLHPEQHKELYGTLEEILSRFIPLWNRVLTDLRAPKDRRQNPNMGEDSLYGERPKVGEDEDEDQAWEDWHENRQPNVPVHVGPYEPRDIPKKCVVDLNGRKLQVIVKLANIEIDPAKGHETYDGGAWHVEGMKNEHIVASGIYYYHTENITESKLSFRINAADPENYEQCDYKGVAAVYGLENEEPAIQDIGSVTCIQGRSIAWPNILQHQVQSFSLVDKKKKGLRKILVFFLVDPTQRVLSTSIVPPQQQTWMQYEMKKKKPIPGMPPDLQGLIGTHDWHFTHDLALKHRLDLMAERKVFVDVNTKQVYERPCSLCEH